MRRHLPVSVFHRRPARGGRRAGGFTLAEVLAALLFMAIVIPVAMQGMSVASRAGILGQRKATAMRIAERVLDELIVTGQMQTGASTGSIVEGDTTFPWTMTAQPWSEDTMTVLTVLVTFELQGRTFEAAATTLYDPATVTGATGGLTP